MTAATTLSQLQWQQLQHDIAYHSDIYQLPPARSLTHMTLHQTKYMARLTTALATGHAHDVRKIITDAFVITLATANILNQELAQVAGPRVSDLGALGCVLLRNGAANCDAYNAAEISTRYATLCGDMAKACEAFDHAEDYPSRKVLADSNVEIFKLVVMLASQRNIDLASAYQARIAAVEAKSVFNAQIEKMRSDRQAPSTPADPNRGTRGTPQQHR